MRVHDLERRHRSAVSELVVDDDAVLAPEVRVGWMHRDARAGPFAQLRRRAEVIAIGEHDARHPSARERGEHGGVHLDRIDRDIAGGMTNERTVEVVAMPLGEPGPGQDAGHDLAQGHLERVPRRIGEWKMTKALSKPK